MHGARAVLAPPFLQAKVQEKRIPHTSTPFLLLEYLLSSLHLVGHREGKVEDRVQQPILQFPLSLTSLFFSQQDAPIVLNHVKKTYGGFCPLESLIEGELRVKNLIHFGLLCLNPWGKVFNQLWGDRAR